MELVRLTVASTGSVGQKPGRHLSRWERGGVPLGTIWASLRRHLGPLLVTPEPHLAPFAPNFDPGWPMPASRTHHSAHFGTIRAPAACVAANNPDSTGHGAVAARGCCFLLPRLRRNPSRTQNMLPRCSEFCRPNFLGRQNPIKQAFVLCVIFFGTSKTGFRTPRWVLNGTQLRSEWAPLPPDGC